MASLLKQSTTVTIRLGPFLDAGDGVTEETGLGSMGVEISKNHGAFGARNSATATAHDAEGWYSCELDTTDTNTLGPLTVKSHASATHLPVWREFMVVPAMIYDSLVAGSDVLQADVTQLLGTAWTAPATAGLPDANVKQVSGSATAADNLEAGALGIVSSSALTGTLTTTAMTTNLTEATNDHYNGRVIVWTSGVLAGEAREILDYDGATKKLTYSTTTDAPSNGDSFVIV